MYFIAAEEEPKPTCPRTVEGFGLTCEAHYMEEGEEREGTRHNYFTLSLLMKKVGVRERHARKISK